MNKLPIKADTLERIIAYLGRKVRGGDPWAVDILSQLGEDITWVSDHELVRVSKK